MGHQTDRTVVGRLETVVPETSVAQQFETLSGDVVACPFGVVTTLEQRLQKVTGIVGEFVQQQMSDAKILKSASSHQPAQVRR